MAARSTQMYETRVFKSTVLERYHQNMCPRRLTCSDTMFDLERETMVDPTAVFAILFGSELFEDYIGRLVVATRAFSGLSGEIEAFQEEREEKLAETLKRLLQQYVQGDIEGFEYKAESEAKQLSHAAFGADILHTIGDIYARQAAQELGKKAKYLEVPSVAWVRNTGQIWKSHITAAKEAFHTHCQFKMDGSGPEMDKLMNSARKLNEKDTEVTLLHVCKKVLQESDVGREQLKVRAMALNYLGEIFQREKDKQRGGTSKKTIGSHVGDDEEDSQRLLNHLIPMIIRGIGGLFKWLCTPPFD